MSQLIFSFSDFDSILLTGSECLNTCERSDFGAQVEIELREGDFDTGLFKGFVDGGVELGNDAKTVAHVREVSAQLDAEGAVAEVGEGGDRARQ